MSKIQWKPGNMLYPLPAVLISCGNKEENYNLITISWAGTICTNPPMTSISIKPDRYSYNIIKKTKEFVINLTTESMVKAVDFCGVRSGKDTNKIKETGLSIEKASIVKAPLIIESPVNIECKVVEVKPLGSHDMFIANVVAVHIEDSYVDSKERFHLDRSKPICYSHGQYYGLGNTLGSFGFSVKKAKKRNKNVK